MTVAVVANNGRYSFCCSNKSNLALLSCYGFFIPGNVNDAQLLKPMFSSCLAAAQGVQGFEERLIKEALGMLAAPAAATDTDDATEADAISNSRSCRQAGRALLRASHQRCAAAALPLAVSDAASSLQEEVDVEIECAASGVVVNDEPPKDPRKQLQLQRYLAELLLYQVQLVMRLLGTTTQEDELLLQQLRAASVASADGGGIIRDKDHLSLQQAVAARMDQKLLLLECQSLLKQLLAVLDRT